ncbi:MAG: hypothetical protein OEZ59_06880 [Deltaproteobacteria bacterium]|nr:hypothetical protein [Deltaproteobacteria bacterium]
MKFLGSISKHVGWPEIFLVLAIILIIVIFIWRRRARRRAQGGMGPGSEQTEVLQPIVTEGPGLVVAGNANNIRYAEIVKSAEYQTIIKVEEEFRGELRSAKMSDEDREQMLVNTAVRWRVHCMFERIYQNCLLSQYDLLELLNGLGEKGVTMAQGHAFFQKKCELKKELRRIDYKVWLSYLTTHGLINEQFERLVITELGKDYLIYLASTGSRKSLWNY